MNFLFCFCSAESGQDNPFRPDGDLSREADELVELLKGGRPISEVLKNSIEQQQQQQEQLSAEPAQHQDAAVLAAECNGSPTSQVPPRSPSSQASPVKEDAVDASRHNGDVAAEPEKKVEPAKSVEVQRAVVAPAADAGQSQVEHVVIKKKSKCHCCVIQ